MQNCWQAFWQGAAPALLVTAHRETTNVVPEWVAVLSGSFNPLHQGHREMAEIATRLTGKPCLFELSIANVDKPFLIEDEVTRRLAQFKDYLDVVITREATFRGKSQLFTNATFVLGYDTAERTLSTKYYRDEADMYAALRSVAARGNNFLIACRCLNGELKTCNDLIIPDEFRMLFNEIPVEIFRMDISSTELRKLQ